MLRTSASHMSMKCHQFDGRRRNRLEFIVRGRRIMIVETYVVVEGHEKTHSRHVM